MKEYIATITQRGQVTIPAEVRRLLGTRTGDKLAFQVEGETVQLRPVRFTLESAYASVRPLSRPEDLERVAQEAKDEHVRRQIKKMRRP